MDVSTTIKKFGLEQAFKYLYKDPEKNLLKLMDWADKFSGGEFVTQRKMVREAMTNPEQRTETYRRIRHYRVTKPLFAMDFQKASIIAFLVKFMFISSLLKSFF